MWQQPRAGLDKKRALSTRSLNSRAKFSYADTVGISLYRSGCEAIKSRARSHKRDKERKEAAELSQFSFTPNINRTAAFSTWWKAPEDTLLERYEQQKRRLARRKSERELVVKKECPFHPEINPKSEALAKRKARSRSVKGPSEAGDLPGSRDDIFHTLYSMAKLPSTLSLAVPKNCTFQPKVHSWNYITKTKAYVAQPLTQRLMGSKAQSEEKLERTREKKEFMEKTFDAKTGQRLHNPKISRGPKKPVAAREQGKPPHERLYKDRYLEAKKSQAVQKDQLRWKELTRKKAVSTQSEKILRDVTSKKVKEVFRLLDPDTCGTISKTHIRLNGILSPRVASNRPVKLGTGPAQSCPVEDGKL